jgi:Na+/proline symporter/nitrogen-specific signal transduction histidine kinase
MIGANMLLAVSLGYVALLFALAFFVDRSALRGGGAWLRSPVTYTLSLSIYCTAWTFYGAVGSAARSGLEFATIYIGPTLVFVGWWWLLRKLVWIGRAQRITSIADLISSRYGKSGALAVLATLTAVVATTPYIALQLQSVTLGFGVMLGDPGAHRAVWGFWIAAGMAAFTILFGTRSLDANERHYGVVAAIAVEAVVKLAALVAIGVFAIWGVGGGIAGTFAATTADTLKLDEVFGARWVSLLLLSATAIICLPRQFHVTVVENSDNRQLATAAWMFPLYLFIMSIFVLPIAAAGLATLPPDANPDMFVLTLPLSAGRGELALLAFIGGFSSATSMVIVSTIALSTMVSNHIVTPLALAGLARGGHEVSGDLRRLLLLSRRWSIVGVLALGYIYFLITGGSDALATMGIVAFLGVAQFLPGVLGALFWRGASKAGAIAGLSAGVALWCYTSFMPSFGAGVLLSADTLAAGPWGIAALRPQALGGIAGADPLVNALGWSLGINALLFITVSLLSRQSPMERLQGALFVDVFRLEPLDTTRLLQRSAASEDLFILAQRLLGAEPAHRLFAAAARAQGLAEGLPAPTPDFIARLERELAGSVGAASAHAMVTRTAGGETISLTELVQIADETAQLLAYSRALAAKSREFEEAAAQLRAANARLMTLDSQKDAFLSQVSHELRTPMTSVRSFSRILLDEPDLPADRRRRFAGIIHSESLRLTRLLDEILDLSFLEKGEVRLAPRDVDAEEVLTAAAEIALAPRGARAPELRQGPRARAAPLHVDPDRLSQVFINLLGNAVAHNDKAAPWIRIESRFGDGRYEVVIEDNGPGIAEAQRERVFDKFVRGASGDGAGLGLAISREIVQRLGGTLDLLPQGAAGARFRVRLPAQA